MQLSVSRTVPLLLLALASLPALLLGAPAARAQEGGQTTAEPAVELPNAAALVRKALRATGELDSIAKTSARTLTGTIQIAGAEESGTLRVVQARPDRFLQETSIPGVGTASSGHDGKTTWLVHPNPAIGVRVLDGIVAAQERMRNAFDFGLHSRKHVRSMETTARQPFDGRDCYVVRCELAPFVWDGKVLPLEATARYRTFTEYYEVQSGFLAGTDVTLAGPLGDLESTTLYRAYAELAPGVQVATQVVTRVGEQEILTRVTSLAFDPVEAATFAPPTEVRELQQAAPADADSEPPAETPEGAGGDGEGGLPR